MSADRKVCRLCLQFMAKEVPYSLINSGSILQNLKHIACDTVRTNLLIEEAVVCKLCETKVKEFKLFKETVATNEIKIQQNQHPKLSLFLETITTDIGLICRLCLKASKNKKDELKNWQERKKWFLQCNLHLNQYIKEPSKICSSCDTTLQNLYDFLVRCAEMEKEIFSLANKKGQLSCSDLYEFALSRAGSSKEADTNADDQPKKTDKKPESDVSIEQEVATEFKNTRKKRGNMTIKSKSNNTILKYMSRKPQESSLPTTALTEDDSHLKITKTPKTYVSKKRACKKEISSSEHPQPVDVLTNRKYILKKMNEQLRQMHESIDASPMVDISDITLELNNKGVLSKEIPCEYNETQELLDFLENTLGDDVPKDSAEENGDTDVNNEESGNQSKKLGDKPAQAVSSETKKKSTNKRNITKTRSKQASIITTFKDILSKNLQHTESEEITGTQKNTGLEIIPVAKKQVRKSDKKTTDGEPPFKKQNVSKEPNAPIEGGNELNEHSPNKTQKPVKVTIIKSKKRTNKAVLDKTWQKLTGQPVVDVEGIVPTGNIGGGVEIQVVKKRRGRKPIYPPGVERKKKVEYMYCPQCPFKTYAQNSYTQHILIHNVMADIPTLHCDICPYKTQNKEFMTQHKVSHITPRLNFKCVFCELVFKKKNSCMYHTLTHVDLDIASQFYCCVYNGSTDEEYFECYQCDYQNQDESIMPDHVIEHTIDQPKNPIVAKYKCNICTYVTKTESLLERHKKVHEYYAIKKGVKVEPDQDTVGPSTTILKCDKCHYITKNERSLINHKGLKHNRILPPLLGKTDPDQVSNEDRPIYYCNECSYSTYRKVNLPRHALVHRTKANMEYLECAHCLFETKHRRSLTRHMEVIHGTII